MLINSKTKFVGKGQFVLYSKPKNSKSKKIKYCIFKKEDRYFVISYNYYVLGTGDTLRNAIGCFIGDVISNQDSIINYDKSRYTLKHRKFWKSSNIGFTKLGIPYLNTSWYLFTLELVLKIILQGIQDQLSSEDYDKWYKLIKIVDLHNYQDISSQMFCLLTELSEDELIKKLDSVTNSVNEYPCTIDTYFKDWVYIINDEL